MSARIRTGYSFRRAAGKLEDVIERLRTIGQSCAPITDTTTFGWSRWSQLAPKAGLRPVYGVEIAVDVGENRPWSNKNGVTKAKPALDPWIFLAKNSVVPLHKLLALATDQDREPRLTIPQALSVPDLFVIVGHRFDPAQMPETPPGVFVGLSPACSPGFLRRCQERGHVFIATGVNRYPTEQQKPLYEVLAGRNRDVQSYPQHILSDREWRATVPPELADHALGNRDAILAQSVAELPRGQLPIPEHMHDLRTMCKLGALERRIGLVGEYGARLDHELALIAEKKFEDYFYIVADICQFARKRMLVGPARGSSCGSLVCYLLGITTIDPIPFGLLFERFIDTSRDDLPDIDIDFSEQHRDLVFEFVRERYGAERVARLGTVNFYQVRSAFKETLGALDLPPWTADPLLAIAEESGIAKAFESEAGIKLLQSHPEIRIALELEGHPRHAGQHAAGVVITHGPVTDVVAVDHRTGATMCDKLDAEKLNLLKIDALVLLQISIFEHALNLAKLPRQHLFQVPLDDPKAFAVLNAQHYAGIFQFNGKAVQEVSKAITVENIHDIVAIIALARPGPLNSGAARQWVRARNKHEMENSTLNNLLPETFGLIVYQEQVMRICREIGMMDWANVNALRRVIARTQGVEELAKFRELFVAGAIKHMDQEQAEKLWSEIVTFGGYGFNKSHAVTYGIIGYWCCWLKAHHALEFAAAMLSYVGEDQQLTMLREMEHEGVPFVAADPKLSTDKWTVGTSAGKRQLLGPLTNIVGIGPTHCATIISARARNGN
jgi:DNA polymerase III alpha subunit